MMQAAKYDASEETGISMSTTKTPKAATGGCLKSGKVLVKVVAAGVNPVDAKFIWGDKLPESWLRFALRRVNGFIPGFDFSGIVIDSKTPEFKSGDEVFGLAYDPAASMIRGSVRGSFAEYALVPDYQIAKKPASLSHAEAASLPLVGTTCIQAFEQHSLSKGQRLLVIGSSGGVGHVAVLIASRMGINVVGVCSKKNIQFVESCGANTVIDYSDGDVIKALENEAETNGQFDVILDCVNSADSRDQAAGYYKRIKSNGKILKGPGIDGVDKHNYVVLGGRTKEWGLAATKRFKLGNWFPKGFELFWINMPQSKPALKFISKLCDEEEMKPKIDQLLPFTEEGCQKAFSSLQGRATAGKIVIQISQEE